MDELETTHHGFIAGVVIFWFLAAGLIGTAFVFYQATEQSRLRTEQMGAEKRRVATETVALERAVEKLRSTLDSDASEDQAAMDTVKAAVNPAPHIDAALRAAEARLVDLAGQVAMLTNTKTDLDQQLARVEEERRTADTTLSTKIKTIEARIGQRTAQVNQRVGQLSDQLTDLTRSIDALEAKIESERDTMKKDLIEFDSRLQILLRKRRELKDELRLILQFRPVIVGQVVAADTALNFAHVNLGRQHGLTEGMRFSVYGPGAVFRPNLKPKAALEINRLDQRRSQARIVHQNLGDPVVAGDLLVNIAFDPRGRKPTFVLARFLDIDNDNVDDRDDIIKIIQSQGGTVLPPRHDYVDVNTDFVLEGAEWNRGSDEERPLAERDDEIINKAMRRSVTRLDIETFLNYIGYPKWK